MTELSRWIERKFKFDFPVTLYPNIRLRLRDTPARLEEITGPLSRVQLVSKPDGKWSIQESVGHLLDVESPWLTRQDQFLAGGTVLTAADISNT
jgi:hypothetical protein